MPTVKNVLGAALQKAGTSLLADVTIRFMPAALLAAA
jgi:hypothetical protein